MQGGERCCVYCEECGYKGPEAESRSAAVEAWKRQSFNTPEYRKFVEYARIGKKLCCDLPERSALSVDAQGTWCLSVSGTEHAGKDLGNLLRRVLDGDNLD